MQPDNFNVRRRDQGRARQAETVATAENDGKPWTAEEDAAIDTTTPIVDVAKALGRTYWAVHLRRQKLGLAGRYEKFSDDGPVLCPCGEGPDHLEWCPDR